MSVVRTQPERTGKRAKYEDESATADKEEKARAPIFFDTSAQGKRKVEEIEELGAVRRKLAEDLGLTSGNEAGKEPGCGHE